MARKLRAKKQTKGNAHYSKAVFSEPNTRARRPEFAQPCDSLQGQLLHDAHASSHGVSTPHTRASREPLQPRQKASTRERD